MRLHRTLLAAPFVLAAACAAPRPPELPHVRASVHGTVHGTSIERVDYVARTLDELAVEVPLTLPDCVARPLDVRLVGEMSHANWAGATYTTASRTWIELPEAQSNALLRATLAHELVHALLGTVWAPLPSVVEEGLCDAVAYQIEPTVAPLERGRYAIVLGIALDGEARFTYERRIGSGRESTFAPEPTVYTLHAPIESTTPAGLVDALRYDDGDLETAHRAGRERVLYALGYLIVSRVGAHELHQLCRRAHVQGLRQVPPDWLLRAAGLDADDPTGWRNAIDQLLGDAEKRALLMDEGVHVRPAP